MSDFLEALYMSEINDMINSSLEDTMAEELILGNIDEYIEEYMF